MRKLSWAAALVLILCLAASAQENVLSCGATGAVRGSDTEATLKSRFGARIQQVEVDMGEGTTEPGTVLRDERGVPELYFTWKDSERKHPATIRSAEGAKWQMENGIRIGTDLRAVARLNGGPFTLSGWGWDYAGTVVSWNSGKVKRLDGAHCHFFARFALPRAAAPTEEQQQLINQTSGEGEFSSSNPAMAKLNPRVYEIFLVFH